MTTDLIWAVPTEKPPILRSAEKCYFWPKMHSSHKNTQKLLKDWCLFWKRILLCLHNFSRSWLEHGVQQEVVVSFGPQNLNFWPKTPFFAIRPQILSTSHFWLPWRDSSFPTLGVIFRLFVSQLYASKSLPPPHCLPVTALARGLDDMSWFIHDISQHIMSFGS